MPQDALAQLRAENPLPELLPGPPLDLIRETLEREPASIRTFPPEPRWTARYGTFAVSFATTLMIAAVAFGVSRLLPAKTTDGFTVAQAKAAIDHEKQIIGAARQPVRYTEVIATVSTKHHTLRQVGRRWTRGNEWRESDSDGTVPDVAFLGGTAAYYVASRQTVYVDRSRALVPGAPIAPPLGVSGVLPDIVDPLQDGISAVLNVEKLGASFASSSFAGDVKRLMKLPRTHVRQSSGRLSVRVQRGDHTSKIIADARTYDPILIQWSTGPNGFNHISRYIKFAQPLPARIGARALDLLHAYPHAKVVTFHARNLQIDPAIRP